MALGLLGVAFGIYTITLEDNAHWLDKMVGGAIPALIGGFLTAGGNMIAHRRGGLYATETQYLLNGDSESDVLAVDFSAAQSLHTWEFQERFGEVIRPTWVIELVLRSGVRILLGESDDERGLKHVAHEISQSGPMSAPIPTEPEVQDTPLDPTLPQSIAGSGPKSIQFRVGVGGSLARTLIVGGPSMALVGVLLMSNVEHNHVFGFLFGPLFLALGCALAAVPLTAAFARCQFTITEDCISIEYQLGTYKYGRRQIPHDGSAYVRIRQRGLLGAGLEVISDGHVLLAMNSVHSTTTVTPSDLLRVATWITAKLR
jgi:hypothetical protein